MADSVRGERKTQWSKGGQMKDLQCRLPPSCAWVCNDKFWWRLASCVYYGELTLDPVCCKCLTLWTELFEMMSSVSHFQNNRSLPPLPLTRSLLLGLVGDYRRQTLVGFRPSCNYFASLCQSCWVKTGCRESWPDGEGEEERRCWWWRKGADMLWYQMKSLQKPWELDSRGVRTAGSSLKFCFKWGQQTLLCKVTRL